MFGAFCAVQMLLVAALCRCGRCQNGAECGCGNECHYAAAGVRYVDSLMIGQLDLSSEKPDMDFNVCIADICSIRADWVSGGFFLLCGNGGSVSTAAPIANENALFNHNSHLYIFSSAKSKMIPISSCRFLGDKLFKIRITSFVSSSSVSFVVNWFVLEIPLPCPTKEFSLMPP